MKVKETSYVSVEPHEISGGLSKIFTDLRKDGREYARSANRNMLVLSSGRESGACLDALLHTFSEVHPSRFFVLIQGSEEQRLKVEISIIGVAISKTEESCSEVIRISAAPKDARIVAEIVRSQILSGMAIELALFDPGVPREVIERFASVADVALYDSTAIEGMSEVLGQIVELAQPSIDTQWLVLAPWRDEIRRVFDRPNSAQALPHLTAIHIESLSPDPSVVPPCSALLAGWIGSRLGFTRVVRSEGRRKLVDTDGRSVTVSFSRKAAALDSLVSRITLAFGDYGEVQFERDGAMIRTVVGIAPEYRSERPIEDEARDAVLRRYFQIGESTTNYPSAMRCGLQLR